MAQEPRKPKLRKRRIIERPRLIRALDRSAARVRMLVAGSGYGKTILAEQWAGRDQLTVGWFRARHSAADVAVVARTLVAAADDVIPGAGRRLLERLSVTQDPERESTLLAEMLAEDLTDWPDHGWIVIDDYQHLAVSVASETFVRTLVDRSPVRLLVAARDRPSWVRPRSILLGEVLEIPQPALAMGTEEVEELLSGAQIQLSAGLVALADGWPAVIGLAAMAADTPLTDVDLPETLSEYFADELFGALDPPIRAGLSTLAAMPLIDRELAVAILGAEQAARVCDDALALGILDERDARLELHPLVERFLERRGGKASDHGQRRAAAEALRLYRERGDWDPAFDLVRRFELESEFVDLMLEAIDDTVHGGRLVTLREWIDYAKSKRLTHPVVVLGETELHLRTGRHTAALTLARAAIEDARASGDVKYRLTAAAARAAHVGSREE
jgi:ATP/maltotriose-dependent transcriptional regulator MalT